eukprot:9150108-Prorocentrum_lima.AAC.1
MSSAPASQSHANADPDRLSNAQIMDELRAFNGNGPAWEDFYPNMERWFGPEWKTRNNLKMQYYDDYGGRWHCAACDKTPVGHAQLIAHVQSSQHMRWLAATLPQGRP